MKTLNKFCFTCWVFNACLSSVAVVNSGHWFAILWLIFSLVMVHVYAEILS